MKLLPTILIWSAIILNSAVSNKQTSNTRDLIEGNLELIRNQTNIDSILHERIKRIEKQLAERHTKKD